MKRPYVTNLLNEGGFSVRGLQRHGESRACRSDPAVMLKGERL